MHFSVSIKISRLIAPLLVSIGCSACAADSDAPLPLRIGQHAFQVEIAATPQQREHGLMGRTHLPANGGMLFVFEQAARHCFWMRNTPLPLSIAFVDDSGRIANLADMQAQTDTLHCPTTDVRYALEIAQGGFQQRSIAAGAQVNGLPQ
ncbi:MAG: DUF192 domain-containing protein [Thiobacillus sp.]